MALAASSYSAGRRSPPARRWSTRRRASASHVKLHTEESMSFRCLNSIYENWKFCP